MPAEKEGDFNYDFAWEEYQAKIKAEQEYLDKGIDIFPDPGFVLKTWLEPTAKIPALMETNGAPGKPVPPAATSTELISTSNSQGMKVFINMCSDPAIGAPHEDIGPDGESRYRVPLSCGPLRRDVGKGMYVYV